MLWAQKQKGFTIVELLIVIVVIAILAAIAIVAYNGIQNRAKDSAAQSAASQIGKKISAFAITNAELYPTTAEFTTATGMVASNNQSTPYQYTVSADQKTFCLTATTNNISYYVSNTSLKPTAGLCPAHGPNVITNLATNPSLEASATNWSLHSAFDGPGSGRLQDNGKWVMRGVRDATGATAIYILQTTPITATPSTVYSGSVLLTSSVNQTISMQIRLGGTNTQLVSNDVPLTAGVPVRASVSGNIGTNSSIYLTVLSANGAIGDVITADEAMLTEGSTIYPFADGTTTNWMWNGTAHLSSSSGTAP